MVKVISDKRASLLKSIRDNSTYAYIQPNDKWKIDKISTAASQPLIEQGYVEIYPVDGSNGRYCQHVYLSDKGKQALSDYLTLKGEEEDNRQG